MKFAKIFLKKPGIPDSILMKYYHHKAGNLLYVPCAILNSAQKNFTFIRRYIHREVWEIWEGEMLRTLRSPLFRREWKVFSTEFTSFPEFFRYVEKAQNSAEIEDPREQERIHVK